ncbi:type IV pilus biogenesis protein PilM [Pseudomonas sp. SDO528_S397]
MKKGFFGRKTDAVIGVDINDTCIRLVELAGGANACAVRAWATQPLPAQAVVDGNLLDLDAVAQALGQALSQLRTSLRNAAVAVAGPSVITRLVELETGLDDDEMMRRIHLEADQYIPYPLDDMALDFQIRGISAHDAGRVEVLVVACLKEQVEAREAVLALAGLTTRVVDVEAFALARANGQSLTCVASGHGVNDAQWAVDAQGMGVACGLALRSFD